MPTLTERAEADLGQEFAIPAMTRLTQVVNIAVWLFVGNLVARFLWENVLALFLIVTLTTDVRAGAAGWIQWIVVLALVVLLFIASSLIFSAVKPPARLYAWILGPPAFGVLGGIPTRQFRLVVKSQASMGLRLSPDDADFLDDQQRVMVPIIERSFRDSYEKAVRDGKIDPAKLDWPTTWSKKILGRMVGGVSFADTLRAKPPVWSLLVPRLAIEHQLVLPLVALYSLLTAWLAARAAVDATTARILIVAQVGLLGSVVIALLVYVNHIHMFAELRAYADEDLMARERDAVPEEFRSEWDAHVARYRGRRLHPVSFEPSDAFVTATGAYFSRLATAISALNAAVVFGVAVIATLVGLAISDEPAGELLSDLPRFGLGFLALPVLMALGASLGFALMRNVGRFASLMASGVILALVPLLFTYLFTGDLPDEQVDLLSAIVTGLLGAAGTAIADTLKSTRRA